MNSEERLVINKLVIENFKSYAGKQVLGPFHESFTSVVGPNGSGKSNVIDAILFVFGYRSARIRSKKLSMLIHTSEKWPNIHSCTVYVHFRKYNMTTKSLNNDFELVVSRTARKDSSNDYYVNGNKSSFKEVSKLLRDYAIDLDHNRFLILQGEVEQISLMKPKSHGDTEDGMLEFLEDIIGTNTYNEEINNLNLQVEAFDEQMVEKYNRAKIVEKEKETLEPARTVALEYIDCENNLNTQKSLDCYLKLKDIQAKDSDILEIQEKLKNQKKELDEELENNTKLKNEKLQKLHELEEIYCPLLKEIEKQTKLTSNIERKYLKLKQDVAHNTENRNKLEKLLEKEKENFQNIKHLPQRSESDLERLNKGKGVVEEEIKLIETKIEEILPELKKKTLPFQKEKQQKDQILLEKNRILSDANSKLNAAKNALDILLNRRDSLANEIVRKKKAYTDLINEQKTKNESLVSTELQIKKFASDLTGKHEEMEALKIKDHKLSNELKEKNDSLENIRSTVILAKNKNKIFTALMKEKDSKRIEGIYGRLGDLAYIDQKYDCAVSSCCSFLDHCVVETMDTAIKCVEFLRNNNLGIGSFIALDKMQAYQQQSVSKIQTPGKIYRIFDLIQPTNPIFLPAFYFAFRDTLVADNIDEGTKTAYSDKQRWRVVTLKGEIVEKNGTITCGGDPIKGRMQLTTAKRLSMDSNLSKIDSEELSKEVETLSKDWEILHSQMLALEMQLQDGKRKNDESIKYIEKLKKELEINDHEISSHNSIMNKLETEYKQSIPDENEVQRLQLEYDQQKKEKDKAQSMYDVVENQIKKINDQINGVKNSLLDSHQYALESKRKFLDELDSEINKVTATIASNQRSLAKAEKNLKEVEANLESCVGLCDKLMEDCEIEEKNLNVEKENLLKMEEQNSGSSIELKNVQTDLKIIEKHHESYRQKTFDLKLKFDDISSQINSYESKVQHIKEQLKTLIHRSYNEFGEEIISIIPEPDPKELLDINRNMINESIKQLQATLQSIKPDFIAIEEYYRKNAIHLERIKELDEFTKERDIKRVELNELKSKRLTEFMEGFSTINYKLKEMYQLITLGGDAELELVDSLDPFVEGVVFSVRPPNKSWKHIANLSGGEKTLSSLSLVFALHHYKPTPFYVMDEIDAALDFRNVSIVANYIKDQTQNAQFIIISLRDNMFELANELIGIYKTEDSTKSVVLSLDTVETTS